MKKLLQKTIVFTLGFIISGAIVTDIKAQTTTKPANNNITCATLVKKIGDFSEFQKKMLERKTTIIKERIEDGTLSQTEGNQIIKKLKEYQAICDGTGQRLHEPLNLDLKLGQKNNNTTRNKNSTNNYPAQHQGKGIHFNGNKTKHHGQQGRGIHK